MTGASDHAFLSVIYSTNSIVSHPKFINIQNFKLLSKNTLLSFINNSSILNDIFLYTDPNMIAIILQLELNSIINVIAPSKIIQFSNNYIPYFDNNIKQNLQTKQNLLKNAMTTNNPDDWRNFKNFRNNLTRLIDKAKTKFYSNKFSNSNDKWQTLKNVTESKKILHQIT